MIIAAATSGGENAGGVLCLFIVVALVLKAVFKARGGG